MSEVDVSCACGQVVRISEFAVGMPMACPGCRRPLDYKQIRPVAASGPAPVETFAAPREGRADPSSQGRRPEQPAARDRDTRRSEAQAYRNETDPRAESSAYAPGVRAEPAPGGRTECARCGRRFRGEWDIHETSSGPLCHICSNRVADVTPQETPVHHVEPVVSIQLPATRKASGLLDEEPEPEAAPSKFQFDPQSPAFRRVLWVAAIGTIVLTIYVFSTEGALPTPEQSAQVASSEPASPMGKLPYALVLAVQGLCYFGGTSLTLYMTMWYRNKLPMDRWWANALHVGVVGLGLGAVQTLVSIVPMIGGICALLVVFWVCFEVYDFGFADFVTLFVMGIPSSILVRFVQIALLGLIANTFL